jgi:hypothetical protein
MAKVHIKTVPSSGKTTTVEVEVKATGSSLEEIAKSQKIVLTSMQVSINKEPVDAAKPHLVHVPAGATITLTEKARGS